MITSLANRVKAFNDVLEDGSLMSDIVREFEPEICEMNTENQLFEKGVTATGISIDTYAPYSAKTIEIKTVKNQPTDRVTLRDEGDFHRDFYLEITNQYFYISSRDSKAEKLAEKYGEDIFGLTDENAELLTHEYIKPELLEKAREIIFG